jgi:hypothetical protein
VIKLNFKAVVNIKNKPPKKYELNAHDIKEAAAEIRRQYSNHYGFEIKSHN